MEIERKFLVKTIPEHLETYESKKIAQGYLCTNPVVRIRRSNDEYYLTYKGGGMMVGTNGNAYNKIYFDLTGSYSAKKDEKLAARVHWEIEKTRIFKP